MSNVGVIRILIVEDHQMKLRQQYAAKLGDVIFDGDQPAVLSIGDTFADKYLIKAQIGRGVPNNVAVESLMRAAIFIRLVASCMRL